MITTQYIIDPVFLNAATSNVEERKAPSASGRPIAAGPAPDKFISDNFTLSGNSSLEEAEIICIGDPDHSSYMDDVLTAELLRLKAGKGDVVLVEGESIGKAVNQHRKLKTDLVEQELRVIGWDSIQLRDKAVSLINLLNSMSANGGTKEGIAGIRSELKRINIDQRGGCLLGAIILCGTGKRTFVLAGSNHFSMDEPLKAHLGTKKYVILTPKSVPDPASLGRDMNIEYYNGSFNPEKEMMLTVASSDGKTSKVWAGWFKDGGKAKTGDILTLDDSACTKEYRTYFDLKPGIPYKVLDLRRYRLNF